MIPQLSAEHYCIISYDIGTMTLLCAVLKRYTVMEYYVRRKERRALQYTIPSEPLKPLKITAFISISHFAFQYDRYITMFMERLHR